MRLGRREETKYWAAEVWTLAAGISLNLGILNLLPFPILDGGLILLLMIESIMRRDISMVVKERIYQAAFVVLVMFFAFVMFNDFSKLQIFCNSSPESRDQRTGIKGQGFSDRAHLLSLTAKKDR